MGKYYFTTLASRPLTFSGTVFRFLICSQIAGRASGVYESQNDNETAILDAAVAARRGVSAIGQEEFEAQKKRVQTMPQSVRLGVSPPRPVQPPKPVELAMGKAGVPSAGLPAKQNDETSLAKAPAIRDLIRERKVNPPQPFTSAAQKTKKASDRATTKAARVVRRSIETA